MTSAQTQDTQSQTLLTAGQTLYVGTLLDPMNVYACRAIQTSTPWTDVWILMNVMTSLTIKMFLNSVAKTQSVTIQKVGLICNFCTTALVVRDMNFSWRLGVRYGLLCALTLILINKKVVLMYMSAQ